MVSHGSSWGQWVDLIVLGLRVYTHVDQRDNVVYWKTKRKIKNDLQGCIQMLTILGRHLEDPSTSTYVRHLQIFSIDIDIFWSQSLFFCTFSRENARKTWMSLSFCVCVCVCKYMYVYINIWFCIFSTYDSGFFGLFPRDKSIYFRHFHRHLQGTLSTFDIDICRHLNRHLYTPLSRSYQNCQDTCVCRDRRAFIETVLWTVNRTAKLLLGNDWQVAHETGWQ